ncbi:MAG: PQQ-binding-like beta-propeller repeat protein, partial [Planctomycetota bacterium]
MDELPPAPVDRVAAERPQANVDNPEVYLNDSFEAADALAKAKVFVTRGRWTEAAEVLQRAIDGAGDKLVRVASGSYTGIRQHISDLIARWPQPGITEYRNLFERDIEAALAGVADSRSVDELLTLFERYFCTAAAAKLADTIGQLAIESGDLGLAEQTYRRVLDRHPDAATHAPRYRAMLAVLAAMRGEAAALGDDGEVKIRWMGQDRPLRDIVAEIGKGFAGLKESAFGGPADRWPIFGGDVGRNRTASCRVDDPGLLWRFDLLEPQPSGEQREGLEAVARGKTDSARELTVFPIAGDGLVFVQRFRDIVALYQNTGALAWRFGGDVRPSGGFDYLEDAPPGWDSPTLHDGRLYASLPGDESPYYSYETPRAISELVCLDAKTGRLIWQVNQRSGDDPLSEVTFDSTPLVKSGRVYVVGRRRRTFGFEDCYLYRLNASDGRVEHRTHLGSASTGTFGTRPATRTIAAMHGDAVYVCTNLGSVAAVSAHTGAVRWLRLYDRVSFEAAQAGGRTARDVNPWHFNPVIWDGGRLICMPTDSTNLVVLSAKSGEITQSIPLAQLAEMEALLGVRGGVLCGVGKEALCYDLTAGSTRWSAALPEGSRLFGRGVWAEDELLVPRREGLSRFRVADGRRADASWDAEGEGGNLLALPDQLLAAGGGRIAAYVRKAEIWDALRKRMAAAPSDPLPAVEHAEVAL